MQCSYFAIQEKRDEKKDWQEPIIEKNSYEGPKEKVGKNCRKEKEKGKCM